MEKFFKPREKKPSLKKKKKNIQPLSEITIKGARGAKIKVFFQGLHMTRAILTLVYNLKFCILDTPFNTTFKYKYILITK